MDLATLLLGGLALLLALVVALAASRLARAAREGAEARAEGLGLQRLLAEREARVAALSAEVAEWRRGHGESQQACAAAEARCAQASEAVARLEAAAGRLREDHAAAVAALRADHEAIQAALREEGARVGARLRSVEEEFGRLNVAHAALQSERDERLASAEREVGRLLALREEMTREFQALAAATLRDTGGQFSEAHHQKLTELLTPFREQVAGFQSELRAVHQEADRDRAVLVEQVRALQAQTQAVSQDAANLARALKGDKQRQGAWGEAQLERYLELMGFQRDVDFTVQEAVTGEEGARQRPDLVLRLPGDKALVIDSKVSLSAYAEAVAAEDDEARERWLRLHAKNVRDRIDELAERNYQGVVDGSIDMVMLFMPIEGAVSAAWDHDAELAAYAMGRGVGLVYPSSLLMALKVVRHLWNVEKRNRNAEAIADRAGRLYDKLAGFIENFEMVGRALESARAAHDRARGQLTKGNGNLVRQVEQLRDLGARTSKTLALRGEEEAEPAILGLPDAEAMPEPDPGLRPAE